jgi:small conductance mechanosensitive channel
MDLAQLAEAPAQLSAAAAMVWAWALAFLPRLAAAAVVLGAGIVLASWAARIVRGVGARTPHLDATVLPILSAVARYAVLILVLIVALGQLGVQTASLLAVLGAAGLAIGLALQGTLQNIAAGIMLIYLRPFRVGDSIETTTVAGTVKEIGLFVTYLETVDGVFYFVPNSAIWNTPLKNYSRYPRRLVLLQIAIGLDADPARARQILLDLATADPRVLSDPAPAAYVESYAGGAALLTLRAWATNATFADVQRSLTELAKARLQSAGIEVSPPQRTVLASVPAISSSAPAREDRPGESASE